MHRNAVLILLAYSSCGLLNGQTSSTPKELQALQDSYQRARATALSPIEKKYSDALTQMRIRFTKESNLESALAVDAELKTLATPNARVAPAPATKVPTNDGVKKIKMPKNAIRVGKSHFLVIADTYVGLEQARADCITLGGRLARITSKEANEKFANKGLSLWIDAKVSPDGNIVHHDDTPSKFTPNPAPQAKSGSLVLMPDGSWVPKDQNSKLKCLCEFPD
jgi:hypothetical protein